MSNFPSIGAAISSDNTHEKRVKVAIVTNIPTPYRLPVFEILAGMHDIHLKVIYCSEREPDREWDLAPNAYEAVYLNERFYTFGDKFIHANPDVFWALRRFKPDVVIGTGFNPTHLVAFLYSRISGCAFVPMTDGTLLSERTLSYTHRWIRQRIYRRSKAFIAASDGGFDLYEAYGLETRKIFKSHLCTNNTAFFNEPKTEKKYDLIFSGRFGELKNPSFAIYVAKAVALKLGKKVSLAFVGAGPLDCVLREEAKRQSEWVNAEFLGFARQAELPAIYHMARIMLFPTLADVWGVVANEALAAGVPVIVSPVAGCVPELVRHGISGFVLPLEIDLWADAVLSLLNDPSLCGEMGMAGKKIVNDYSYHNAAIGIANAVHTAVDKPVVETIENKRALMATRRVVIVQRRMTHYRIALFNLMRKRLAEEGIELIVIQGDAAPQEKLKNDEEKLEWGINVPCRYFLNNTLCWQNPGAYILGSDLVIVAQENKLLFNLWLSMKRPSIKMAYWGHGRNFQATYRNSIAEYIKSKFVKKADWWFAYTTKSAKVIANAGFSNDRTTILDNAIDNEVLRKDINDVTDNERYKMRKNVGINEGPIGLLISSLSSEKRIDFLLNAAKQVRNRIPDFQLLIIGDGPERYLIDKEISKGESWIHWAGSRTGRDKAVLLSLGNVMLNPGVFGLSILDSFIAQVPMITTKSALRSPEAAYIDSGVNGLISEDSLPAYSQAVIDYLNNESLQIKLRDGCCASSRKYTLNNMVENFCNGIVQAISA